MPDPQAPPSTPEERALALWDKIDEHVCRGGCAFDWLEVDTEKAVARIADALREERALAESEDKERLDWLEKYVADWGPYHALGLVWDDEDGIWFTGIDHGPHTGIPIEPLRTGKSNTVREAIDAARKQSK